MDQFISQTGLYDRYYFPLAQARGGDPIYLFFDAHPEETLQYHPNDNGWLEQAVATWVIDFKQRSGRTVTQEDMQRHKAATVANAQEGGMFIAACDGIASASSSLPRLWTGLKGAGEDVIGLAKGARGTGGKLSVHYQKVGGGSDAFSKGFHINFNKGEVSLRPRDLPDGTIEIRLEPAGETKQRDITDKLVEEVQDLLQRDPQGALKRAEGIISTFAYQRSAADAVEQAQLLRRALETGRYVVRR